MAPLRIAVLTVGSLYWRTEPVRTKWRESRLNMEHSARVRVPIRYGRRSKKGTYTMTFAGTGGMGIGRVVPCRIAATEAAHLRVEAESLWCAECNKADMGGALSSEWGAVGAVFRDSHLHEQWLAAWKQIFIDARASSRASVDAEGNLALAWPKSADGAEIDVDALLATSNVETDVPTAEYVADAWIDHPGQEDYFFENVRHGICTPDDDGIWARMKERGGHWLGQMEARFPEAIDALKRPRE